MANAGRVNGNTRTRVCYCRVGRSFQVRGTWDHGFLSMGHCFATFEVLIVKHCNV